jgi:hypothetical protein
VVAHTRGPWKFTAPHFIGTDEADPQTIAYMDEHRNRRRRPEGEQEANARLIAAAPDLAEAVRFAVDYLVGAPGGEVSPDYLVNRLVETLRKAGVER